MSISITTSSKIFNNKQNLIIVFSAFSGEIISKTKDNYVFIYNDNNLVGINVFAYQNDFPDIKEGYHNFSEENFLKIVKKFPEEMKNAKNDSFFRIGLVNTIENHPKNDRLKVLSVQTKDNKDLTIITNLQDLKSGSKYLFAINGAFLGSGLIIKESKMMGVSSQGMICSYKSIGIDKEGIVSIENQDINQDFNF